MLRPQTIPTRRTSHLIAATWMAIGILSPALGAAQSTPPPGTMTFALTGDAILTRRLSPFKEPEYLRMIEIIRSADVAFTNLEVLFHNYNDGYPAAHSGGTWMAAEPFLAGELVWAGFDMVSRANHHGLQRGWTACHDESPRCLEAHTRGSGGEPGQGPSPGVFRNSRRTSGAHFRCVHVF